MDARRRVCACRTSASREGSRDDVDPGFVGSLLVPEVFQLQVSLALEMQEHPD